MKRLLVGLMLAAAVFGGPPLICQRIQIGTAKSLPWKNVEGWAGTDPSYDVKRLTADTLGLLAPGAPMPVRMETMRRAAIYAAQDPRMAEEIALRLAAVLVDTTRRTARTDQAPHAAGAAQHQAGHSRRRRRGLLQGA